MDRHQALRELGVPLTATPTEIKNAHHRLIREWHPDLFPQDAEQRATAEERFKRITEAYQTLLAERKRYAEQVHARSLALRQHPPVVFRDPANTRFHPHRSARPARESRGRGAALLGLTALLALALYFEGGASGHVAADGFTGLGPMASRTSDSVRRAANRALAPQNLLGARGGPAPSPTAPPQPSPTPAMPAPATDHAAAGPPEGPLGLGPAERQAVETTCAPSKQTGAAAYSQCRANELARLAAGPGRPDLSRLSLEERGAIESACLGARLNDGATGYDRCLATQLAQLASGPKRPALGGLEARDREAVLAACAGTKATQGPAAYNACLADQVSQLATAPARPDVSQLTTEQRDGIESACTTARQKEGVAAYRRCLAAQAEQVAAAPDGVDLSSLTAGQRAVADSACMHTRMTEGAAAYDRCLALQVSKLKGNR